MSQQTNAGFNAPGLSVVSDDPSMAAPGAAAAAAAKSGPLVLAASRIAPAVVRTPLSARDAVGVGQHPSGCPVTDCITRCGSGMPVSVGRIVPLPRLASCAVGVGHSAPGVFCAIQ